MNQSSRRRSLSMTVTPHISQSDTTMTNNKAKQSNFLSLFKSPSSNTNTVPTIKPSKSTSTLAQNSLPPINGQKVKRKPVQTSTATQPSFIKTNLDFINKPEVPENYFSKKNVNNKSSNDQNNGNFTSIFKKKRSKSVDKSNEEHEIPEPASKFDKYELPPLSHFQRQSTTIDSFSFVDKIIQENSNKTNHQTYKPAYKSEQKSETIKSNVLSNDKPQSPQPSRWSNVSARKSTGSYSIYSTFGPESVYGDNDSIDDTQSTYTVESNKNDTTNEPINLAQIVANNMQTRTPARIVPPEINNESLIEDNEADEETDDDLDDDVFVDATGMSQEDIERERIEARLSKRLSGGHFGSAGGLLLSIASTSTDKQQRRRSKPPPEDIAKSMINWKRKSGQSLLMFQQQQQEQQLSEIKENPLATPAKDSNQLHKTPPQRPLPPNPEILLPTTEEVDEEECEDRESIKSIDNESGISKTSTDSKDPKECATRLWNEDESFVPREQIAEWLGQSKPLNTATLHEYMAYFDFSKMRLDTAFRKVCSKLYFRAEAQQIDRLLEAFAKRYWQCNPKSILGSSDIVYAVVYSLLLLNTDLHVAQGNYSRMTRQEFVRNTMSTVREQKKIELKKNPKNANYMIAWEAQIEAYLKDMYIAVKNNQILQPMHHQTDINNDSLISDSSSFLSVTSSNKRLSVMGGKRMLNLKQSLNTMIHKAGPARDNMSFQDELSLPRKSTSSANWHSNPTSPAGIPKEPMHFNNTNLLSPNPTFMMESNSLDNRSPYVKEGIVMRKHLLESKNQKAKHREWRECLLVVRQGEFKLYSIPNDSHNDSSSAPSKLQMLKAGGSSFVSLADSLSKNLNNTFDNGGVSPLFGSQQSNSKWAAYTQLIGTVQLNHTLSNALPPPGYNRSRPHVFALQESNGGVYLIQSYSTEQVNDWVATCNYWAARQSKEPLLGGVGNLEYGWGDCLNDVILDLDAVERGKKVIGNYINSPDAVHISNWAPPAPSMITSTLDEKAQFENLQKYVNELNNEINDHREIKKKMLVKFQNKSQNQTKVLANWDAKSTYMLHEIIKYQNYCDALEKSLSRREKV